jgi:hypothetical protein
LLESQLQAELENGTLTAEAEARIANSIEEIRTGKLPQETGIGKLLFDAETKGFGTAGKANWISSLQD